MQRNPVSRHLRRKPDSEASLESQLQRPIIATGRGGSGTRLLSLLLQEMGVFLGNELNRTEDSVEWVDLIYDMCANLVGSDPEGQPRRWDERLRARARQILLQGNWTPRQLWGWKLPENMLILPEIEKAFRGARIIHLVRHPVDTCLRRTHMTSRVDNKVGRATLSAAYRQLGWNRDPAGDDDYVRNAASWLFQVQQVLVFGRRLRPDRYLELRYEDLCLDPGSAAARLSRFLGLPRTTTDLDKAIERARQRVWEPGDPRAGELWDLCSPTATELGYRRPG